MSVVAGDLRFYGCANMPSDDSSTVGGAVDLAVKVSFTDLTANDTINIASDDAGDTDQVYRIYGFSAAGATQQEDLTANGLSTVAGARTFERVNRIEKQSGSALAGTVTVTENSGSTTVATLESVADSGAGSEVTKVYKIAYLLASDPSSAKDVYVKVFARNNNAATTLTSSNLSLMDGPVFSTPTATTVDVNSAAGQKVLSVASTTGFTSGMSVILNGNGARAEGCKIDTVSAGVSVTMVDNLKYAHTAAQADVMAKSRITIDCEDPLDGTDTSTNRVTLPAGYAYTFDASDHQTANAGNWTAGTVQGLWIHAELDAAQAALKDIITLRPWGQTV